MPSPSSSPSALADLRLDVWLWAARFFKTRTLAKQAIDSGKVEIGRQRAKPARTVRVGDALAITRASERFEVQVMALSAQRGSAVAAQALYRESDDSRLARAAQREQRRIEAAGYQPPAGKPDKRARRLIRALGDIEML